MILLDSSAFYWLLTEPARIGKNATAAITSTPNVFVSSITVLELTIKQMLAKLPPQDFLTGIKDSKLKALEFDLSAAASITKFPELVGHDPFDRALLAQALVGNLNFYTSDRKLLGLAKPWIKDIGD